MTAYAETPDEAMGADPNANRNLTLEEPPYESLTLEQKRQEYIRSLPNAMVYHSQSRFASNDWGG